MDGSTRKTWDGSYTTIQKQRRSYAGLFEFLGEWLKVCPSYKDTRSGRAKAAQIRGVELLLGLGIIVWGGRELLPLGIFVVSLILFIPLQEARKRDLRSRLKRARFGSTQTQTEVQVAFDARRLELNIGGKMDRRVLLNKNTHEIKETSLDGKRLLIIRGPEKKRSSQIWLTSDQSPQDNGNAEEYRADDTDILVNLRSDHLDEIATALGESIG